MASILLSTNSKSSYFYFGLIVGISLLAIYFLTIKKPSAIKNFHRQAFQLNYSAFANGIRLAHYQYLAREEQSLKISDRVSMLDKLTFNKQGYPVAKKITLNKQQMPKSSLDCKFIWDNVLGPLRPELSITQPVQGYWVKLSKNAVCIIQSTELNDLTIQYHARKGKVTLVKITD